jgi:hypothetical protein
MMIGIHWVYRMNGVDVNRRRNDDDRSRDDGFDIKAAIGAGNDGAAAKSAQTDASGGDQKRFSQKILAR